MPSSPDLIVLGGDYVSFGDRELHGAGRRTARRAGRTAWRLRHHRQPRRRARHARANSAAVASRCCLTTARRVAIRGERLELAGVKFWTKTRAEIGPVLSGAKSPVLLLAHDPRRVVEAAALEVPGVLAGHTHGGQVVLPLVGALAARKFPVAEGRLTRQGTEMFVSRGVGTVVVPFRINCPPEVAVVTLRQPARATLR